MGYEVTNEGVKHGGELVLELALSDEQVIALKHILAMERLEGRLMAPIFPCDNLYGVFGSDGISGIPAGPQV
jgi:hypothetical protein